MIFQRISFDNKFHALLFSLVDKGKWKKDTPRRLKMTVFFF